MELKPISQPELDNFVATQPHSQFLQSWAWGEFQTSLNRQVWRYGVFANEQLLASASLIESILGFKKSYLYCPRGPIIAQDLTAAQQIEVLKLIFSKTRDLIMQTTAAEEIFFRYELPQQIVIPESKITKPIQPANTLILNLQIAPDQLLNSFHPKTRYNIKLAEKHEITIVKLTTADFEQCWPLFLQTGERDEFGLHPQSYYQKMLALPEMELWVARNKENAIIAANLISFYGDTTTYLHGASDYNFRQLMAPHLLQWTLIKEAKTRGFSYYDFHGIAPDENTSHPWAGVTRFKKGFGGQAVNYAGTFDFIYQPGAYHLYQILRKINRLIKK